MKKLTIMIIMLMLLLLLSVITVTAIEYKERGYIDKNYRSDERGIFNTELSEVQFFSRSLADNKVQQAPIIFDLYGNSDKEIIVADGDEFKILDGISLVPNSSFTTLGDIWQYSLYEYNSDIYLVNSEDVIWHRNIVVHIYNSSDNTWDLVYNHQIDTTGLYTEVGFSCDEATGNCLSVHYAQGGTTAMGFKIDSEINYSNQAIVRSPTAGNYIMCYPSIPDVIAYNFENDDDVEFYLTTNEISTILTNHLEVDVVEVVTNSTGHLIDYNSIVTESKSFNKGTSCSLNTMTYTSPLITDVDLTAPLDIVIGLAESSSKFKMRSYKLDGSDIDDYPEVLNADGQILSNPISGTFFSHGLTDKDFCVLGYIDSTDSVDLVCASEQLPEIFGTLDSRIFDSSSNTSTFDIDVSSENHHQIHVSQHSTQLTDGINLDEVLTPFGVARLTSDEHLEYIYQTGLTSSILIDNDLENVGLADLIVQTQTALVYIDDLFTNQPAEIDGYTINPCVDQVWKTNTSVGVSITPVDPESDQVRAKAILYYNDPDGKEIDSGFSSYANSGTAIQFVMKANSSIGTGTLKLIVNDIENNDTTDNILLNFAVASDGVSFGDCVTTASSLIEEEADTGVDIVSGAVGTPCVNNSQCTTNFCMYNYCREKTGNTECSSDVECLSGQCLNGKCTKASLKQNVDASFEELSGSDEPEDKSFLAIIIMLFVSIGTAVALRNIWGAILGILIFIVLAFTFTLLEWLSPFILIGVVVFILIAFAFMMILGRGSN